MLLVLLAVQAVPILVMPLMEAMYTDLGLPLSTPTRYLLHMSRWMMGQKPGQEIPGHALFPAAWLALLLFVAYSCRRAQAGICPKARPLVLTLIIAGAALLLVEALAAMSPFLTI